MTNVLNIKDAKEKLEQKEIEIKSKSRMQRMLARRAVSNWCAWLLNASKAVVDDDKFFESIQKTIQGLQTEADLFKQHVPTKDQR